MNDVQVSPEEYKRLKLIEDKYNRLCIIIKEAPMFGMFIAGLQILENER